MRRTQVAGDMGGEQPVQREEADDIDRAGGRDDPDIDARAILADGDVVRAARQRNLLRRL